MIKKLMMLCVAAMAAIGAWAATWTDSKTGYTWTYSVEGSGVKIYNYGSAAVSPKPTSSITIPSEIGGYQVVEIGSGAFYNCSSLTGVIIPSTVTSVGASAFYGCGALKSVIIPASVTSIGTSAFQGCGALEGVTIPVSVQSIGYSAFRNCIGLKSVSIPVGISKIEDETFYGCVSLAEVNLPVTVKTINSYAFYGCSALKTLNIPYGVEEIFDNAFYGCGSLPAVTFPASLKTIGSSSFYGCSSLTTVDIPSNVNSVGYDAFEACGNLRNVSVPGTLASSYVFGDSCKTVTNLTIVDSSSCSMPYISDFPALTTLSLPASLGREYQWEVRNYISQCSSLTTISVAAGNPYYKVSGGLLLTKDGSEIVAVPKGRTWVDIPDSVTSVPSGIFSGCQHLYVEHSIPGLRIVDGWVVECDWDYEEGPRPPSILNLTGVCGIANGAFDGCEGLKNVIIGEGVRTIGSSAFDDCYDLESISISSSVRFIGKYAFEDCFRLKSITVASGNAAYEFTGGLLISKDKTQLVAVSREVSTVKIPEGVRKIPDDFFGGCNKLTSVSIPSSIDEYGIGYVVFSCWYERYDEVTDEWYEETIGCPNLKTITVASGNPYYKSIGGMLCSVYDDGMYLEAVPQALTSVTIPAGVTDVNSESFDGCVKLNTIKVASGNRNYKSVNGLLLTKDGEELVWVPNALTSVTIPEGVTYVNSEAFDGCAKLNTIKVASGNRNYKSVNGLLLTKDGKELVWVPNALTSVTIPDGVVDLGRAFGGCEKLTSVKIPDSVVAVGRSTFSECPELLFDKKTIPGCRMVDGWIVGVTDEAYERYGENGEEWNLDLTKARGIAESAFFRGYFDSCDSTGIISGLHSIVIPKNIIAVGYGAFYRCGNLSSVTIESGVRQIAACAFEECHESLYDDTTLPGFRLVDGWLIDRKYYYDDSIKSLDLTGLRGVAGQKYGCSFAEGVTNLVVGGGVTAISHGAFAYSYELEEVEIADSVAFIGENAFLYCTNLKRVKMPDSLRGKVPTSAFSGCSPDLRIEYYKSIFTVEFDANYPPFSDHDGVENVIESRCVESGETIGALPTSVLSKYKFLGWYTAPEGGTKISATTKVTGNVTYYAHWVYGGSAIVSAVVAEGCEAMGKVTGGKTAKAGTKLTLKATPKKGYVFAGWYSDAECTSPVDGAWQVAEYSYKVKDSDATFYARFLKSTDPIAKEITVDAGEFHVVTPGVTADIPISVESACLYTVKASGLPKGLELKRNADKSYRITGKATTPGEKTVTLTVTNVANSKGVSYKFKILVDNWRNDDVFFSEDDWGGKSFIENHYDNMIAGVPVADFFIPAATNCTVSIPKELGLKFNGKTCQVTGTPKAPGKYLVTITKKLKTGYDKKKKKDIYTTHKATTLFVVYQGHGEQCDGVIEPGIILNVTLKNLADGYDYGNIETASTNDVYIGVKQEIAILAEGLEGVANTLKVSGLPKGLEFKNGKITGVPAKAGVYKVKVSASNKWKWTGSTSFALNVLSLPEWARGQFMGEVYSEYDEFFSESFSMSVGSTGKISGKFKLGGTNWTFSASSFVSSMDSYDPEFVCKVNAKATVKVGKKNKTVTSPLEFTLSQSYWRSEIASEAGGVFGPDLSFYARRIPGVKLEKTSGGTVELSKAYGQVGEGKSVKFTAKPSKGYVFAGWYDEDDNLVSQALNYSLKMEDADRFFFARFVTTAEDKSSLAVSDIEEMWTETDGTFRLALGEYITSLSLPKITVSGLPPGLKFTSKRLEIWESICQFEPLVIEANSIYGNATKPGAYTVKVSVSNASVSDKKAIVKKFKIHVPNFTAANGYFVDNLDNGIGKKRVLSVGITNIDDFLPSLKLNAGTAKLAVSGLPAGLKYDAANRRITGIATKVGTYTITLTVTDGKAKYVSTITIEVEALPDWVVGTFRGGVESYGYDWSDALSFEVKVTPQGRVSAKLIQPVSAWGDVSLKTAGFRKDSEGNYVFVIYHGDFENGEEGSIGKVHISESVNGRGDLYAEEVGRNGEDEDYEEFESYWKGYQDVYSLTSSVIPKLVFKTDKKLYFSIDEDGGVNLTFGAKGLVTVSEPGVVWGKSQLLPIEYDPNNNIVTGSLWLMGYDEGEDCTFGAELILSIPVYNDGTAKASEIIIEDVNAGPNW